MTSRESEGELTQWPETECRIRSFGKKKLDDTNLDIGLPWLTYAHCLKLRLSGLNTVYPDYRFPQFLGGRPVFNHKDFH